MIIVVILMLVMVTIFAFSIAEYVRMTRAVQPDCKVDLPDLWNLMRTYDKRCVTLSNIKVDGGGKVIGCQVVFDHVHEGKIRRVAAEYRRGENQTGCWPIAYAIQRVSVSRDTVPGWTITIRIAD